MKPLETTPAISFEPEKWVNQIVENLSLEVVPLDTITPEQRQELVKLMADKIKTMPDPSRTACLQLMPRLSGDPEVRQRLKELNRNKILEAIAQFVSKYGCMPSKARLADATGLSRQTVHLHLKRAAGAPLLLPMQAQHKLMADGVMGTLLQLARKGNVQAARLYMDSLFKTDAATLPQKQEDPMPMPQNNYIQVNGIVISQAALQEMNPEQLLQIEHTFKTVLPKHTESHTYALKS